MDDDGVDNRLTVGDAYSLNRHTESSGYSGQYWSLQAAGLIRRHME
jgi:hypothetical protein